LRILESTVHGGPGKGNLAAVVAHKGVGKTAFLVHLATFQLLKDRHVIHVSFATRTDHITEWYESIFTEVARRAKLEGVMEIHDEIIRNRVLMNFNQSTVEVDRITSSMAAMIGQGHFAAEQVVVDGYDFGHAAAQSIRTFRQFARDMNLEIWFSVSLPRDSPPPSRGSIPSLMEAFAPDFSTIIALRSEEGFVSLELLKDHDVSPLPELRLKLDPKTLLVSE
jgi:hypothetical protein